MALRINNIEPVAVAINNSNCLYIIINGQIVWPSNTTVKSCFSNGYWKDDFLWDDELPWKD